MIRKASLLDINQIYELCVEAWDGAPYAHLGLDEMKTRGLIRDYIKNEMMLALVSVIDEKIEGVLAAAVVRMDMSKSLAANDTMFYCRKGGEGREMIKRYKAWAKERGAGLISLSVSYGDDRPGVLFKSEGFDRMGGNYYLLEKDSV